MTTLVNAEYGIEVHVSEIASGFSVALKDSDSGEFLDTILIFPTHAAAMLKAKEMVA